jgi:DNA-binding NarL/FixJ family response regulator
MDANVNTKKGVFLVDDHPVFRMGLSRMIAGSADLSVIGEASSAEEAVGRIDPETADIALVDISLGAGENGIELIKRLRTQHPKLPILVVSMHDERLYAERALRAGATGFLMKETAPDELLRGIRRALDGEVVVSERLMGTLIKRTFHGGHEEPKSPLDILSNRELEIFELLGRGQRTRDIAELLHISVKTVETHRSNIKQKLNLTNSTELLRVAMSWVEDAGGVRAQRA